MIHKDILLILIALLLTYCSSPKPTEEKEEKKLELKNQVEELNKEIKQLETEIAGENGEDDDDTDFVPVYTKKIAFQSFAHFTKFRGFIKSLRNIKIGSDVSGKIISLNVKEGEKVSPDKIIAVIDPQIIKKQINEVETSLALVNKLYDKQSKLWEQKIGTEIQYLEAKNNKESLETRRATLKTQLARYYITVPFAGIIENLNVREGETVQPGLTLFNIIDHKELYVEADISENFVGKIKKGQTVELMIPYLETHFKSYITAIGQTINPNNRTFKIEIKLYDRREYKPNMTTIIQLKDYENENALIMPTKIIQQDAIGYYVFISTAKGKNHLAKRKYVQLGKSYQNKIEIIEGLQAGDLIITEGYRDLQEGDKIKMVQN